MESIYDNAGFSNIAIITAATTLVASGAGYVEEIRVPGGALGNVTIYDSLTASGTVLLPTVTPVSGAVLLKHVAFSTGLCIVTAAATAVVGTYIGLGASVRSDH